VPFVVFHRSTSRYFKRLGIGNIVVRDVPALVHPDEVLGVNLLGMSFLSRVRWTYERGRLVIEQ
jgi:aspartyl protease family protein